MANEKHLYLTVGGGYTSSAVGLTNETWQIGVRLALVWGEVDAIGTLPDNWEPYADPQTHTETSWTTSSNWSISGPLTTTFNPCDYLTQNAGPAAAAWIAASGVAAQIVELRELRLYPIGPDGRALPAPPYAQGSPALLTYTGTLPSGGMTTSLPPQTTPVVTLQTSQVGRRGRGRYYSPMMGAAVMANGVMSSSGQTALLAASKTFLEDVSVAQTAPTIMNVRPIVTGAPWTTYGRVDSIRIGRAFDTQRRRRRSADESYSSTDLDIG